MLESPFLTSLAGYIGGAWTSARDGAQLSVHNPADGSLLAQVPAMGATETEQAITAAATSLQRPAPLMQRRQWLHKIAEVLHRERREIGRIITHEHGKPWPEAQGEVDYAAGFFAYAAEHLEVLEPRRLPEQPQHCEWMVHHRPAGVVGLITPWNFPIAMLAKKLSAALAADCGCIVKPSSKTPLTTLALFHLLDQEVKLPAGKANLVIGPAGPISQVLCKHPQVSVISFTGSTAVGKQLIRDTADQVKRLTLELGGNAPLLVFADADLDHATDQLIANKFRGSGQTCVCANRVYVQTTIAEDFAERVAARVRKLKVGPGMDEGVDLGPLIDRAGFEKVHRHLQDALAKGAQCLAGGNVQPPSTDYGWFFPPTVLKHVTEDMACLHEETFGPLIPIVGFSDEEEAIAKANSTEYGLAGYFFTADSNRAQRLTAALRFGHIGWNTATGPTPEAPFGGVKQSGYGREGGIEGLYEFTETQTVPHFKDLP